MMRYALVLAGGIGQRMGLAGNKALHELGGKTILARSVEAFCGLVDEIVVVARAQELETVRTLCPSVNHIAEGGDTRQRSVLSGLRALSDAGGIVLVHDAARPFVSRDVIARCIASAEAYGSGVAAVPVKDTIKQVDADGHILHTPDRAMLYAAQTPQTFRVGALRAAIEALEAKGITATDDASAMEAMGETVHVVMGAPENVKLTEPADLRYAQLLHGGEGGKRMRVGYGYDVHKLVANRPLILCGVTIPHETGLLGHSDADVALHALTDALLGAAALGDIGALFPDTDEAYRGISSLILLEKAAEHLRAKGFSIGNVDVTIVAQRPKLLLHIPQMIQNVQRALCIDADCVSIKATTSERLGFEGEELGMSAHAVAAVYK